MTTSPKEIALRNFLTNVVGTTPRAPTTSDQAFRLRYRGYSDSLTMDRFIHTIPRDQLEVLICLNLGMTPKEITVALRYPSIVRYYNISANLRRTFRERKGEYREYT